MKRFAQFLTDLSHAFSRVGTEYHEVAQWSGEHSFTIVIDLVGLDRESSDRMMAELIAYERISEVSPPKRSEALAALRMFRMTVKVDNTANIAAAGSLVLDAVRRALVATRLADDVEQLLITGTSDAS